MNVIKISTASLNHTFWFVLSFRLVSLSSSLSFLIRLLCFCQPTRQIIIIIIQSNESIKRWNIIRATKTRSCYFTMSLDRREKGNLILLCIAILFHFPYRNESEALLVWNANLVENKSRPFSHGTINNGF